MIIRLIFSLLVLVISVVSLGQDDIDELEQKLASTYGINKLILLNQLTARYLESNPRKAIKYGKQAVDLSERIIPIESLLESPEQSKLRVDAYNLLGEAHFNKEHFYDAQQNFKLAKADAEKLAYLTGKIKAATYLVKLDSIGVKPNLFQEKIGDLKIGSTLKSESQELLISSTIIAAENYEKNGNYIKAISNYEKAINYLKNKGDDKEIAELYRKIANNHKKAGNPEQSLDYYQLAIGKKEKLGDTTGIQSSKKEVENLQEQIDQQLNVSDSTNLANKISIEKKDREDYRKLAQVSESNKDFKKSLEYLKLYTELNDKIIEDEKQQEMALLAKSHEIENNLQQIQLLTQDKEIQELEIQKKESEIKQQNNFRKNLIFGIALLIALASTLYLLYFNKRRDHRRLNLAHLDLQSTQKKLIRAEQKIKTLLDQQVSTEVANELLSDSDQSNIQRKTACIMFLDIRGFTTFAEQRKPEEIITYQNDVFGIMIDSVYKHHGIINQFLGDGFMATFGAPTSSSNDSSNALMAAIEIIKTVNAKSKNGEIPTTRVGIGLHTGKVVVGNVGTHLRKQYSITGNAVIIAARIEQLNKKYNSQLLISEKVKDHVHSKQFNYESLGEELLKGMEKPIPIYKVSI